MFPLSREAPPTPLLAQVRLPQRPLSARCLRLGRPRGPPRRGMTGTFLFFSLPILFSTRLLLFLLLSFLLLRLLLFLLRHYLLFLPRDHLLLFYFLLLALRRIAHAYLSGLPVGDRGGGTNLVFYSSAFFSGLVRWAHGESGRRAGGFRWLFRLRLRFNSRWSDILWVWKRK